MWVVVLSLEDTGPLDPRAQSRWKTIRWKDLSSLIFRMFEKYRVPQPVTNFLE